MKRNKFFRSTVSFATLVMMAVAQLVFVPVTGNAQDNPEGTIVIYNNGQLSTGATSKSGVAAPGGFTWSELSTDNGGGNFSNTTLGSGCQQISTTTLNRCADDFTVPVGQTWTINTIVVYGYQTNSVANPFISANLRIWNGRPGDAGAASIFGDTTTNRMGTVTDSTWFRIGNTLGGAGGTTAAATNTARKLWRIPITVSPALVLTAGTYWIDFQTNAGAGGNFTPLISIPGARNATHHNSRQFVSTTSTWQDPVDIGEPAAVAPNPQADLVPNVVIDFPFLVEGSTLGVAAQTSRFIDYDGDNRTDYSVVRSASATAQTTWHNRTAAGVSSSTEFGLGAGFSAGDKPVPADYDGDGRTDIAVWRASEGAFYILHSSGTLRIEQFGQPGDDPSFVGDYDGNGTDDLAVYRAGASGAQSNFYYRLAANGPVSNAPWGLGGDIAIPGDFDGDGRSDLHVARNVGGSYVHYELGSTAGYRSYPWGIANDRFVTGDFDRDSRSDVVAVRANGASWNWYVLKSTTNSVMFQAWGNTATDFLTPGDYDGDGRTDFAVWRSGVATPQFSVKGSASAASVFAWGSSTGPLSSADYPVANFTAK